MKILNVLIVTCVSLAFAAAAWAGGSCCSTQPTAAAAPTVEKAAAQAQTTCPVMGEPINKKYFVDYKGKRVYFCCNMCPPKFNADPETYMKKLQAEGVELENAPAPEKK